MSNIGKKPIEIKEGVTVTLEENRVKVAGPKGELEVSIPRGIIVERENGILRLKKGTQDKGLEKYHGLARALIANMIEGVTVGFEKKLELSGVGYRARVEGGELVLNVGFAVPVRLKPPEGVFVHVAENVITVSGSNRQLVGEFASEIRRVKPPDPYKAKGIKYVGEKVRRKAGKAAKALGVVK